MDDSVKLIATADNHLGYRQYMFKQRYYDFLDAFKQVVDHALEHQCGIVHSGDILDTKSQVPPQLKFLQDQESRLIKAGLPMFFIGGNHEYTEPSWLDLISAKRGYDLRNKLTGFVNVEDRTLEYQGVVIHGVKFRRPDELREHFQKGIETRTGDILLVHTPMAEFADYTGGDIITGNDFEGINYRCIVVGDTHVEKSFESGGRIFLSPGSTELKTITESSDKHCQLIEVPPSGSVKITPLGLKTIPVVRYTIENEEDLDNAIKDLESRESKSLMVYYNCVKPLKEEFLKRATPICVLKEFYHPRVFGNRAAYEYGSELTNVGAAKVTSGVSLDSVVDSVVRSSDSRRPLIDHVFKNPNEKVKNADLTRFFDDRLEELKKESLKQNGNTTETELCGTSHSV